MITSFEVTNFKCLANLKIDLGPFNVFIGPNDSGKSSALDALHMLGRTVREPLGSVFSGRESLDELLWKKARSPLIQWRVSGIVDDLHFVYTLGLTPGQPRPASESLEVGLKNLIRFGAPSQVGDRHIPIEQVPENRTLLGLCLQKREVFKEVITKLEPVAQTISSSIKYCLEPRNLRSDSDLVPSPELEFSGNNLPSVLDDIFSGPDGSARLEIERQLHETIPTLSGIALRQQPNNGKKALVFVIANGKSPATIPAVLASDGALLTTAFLALAYGNTPAILLVEEPENGLHPSKLKLVIDLLKKVSSGEVGNRTRQVIITTHSPVLLNFVLPEQVRIFARNQSGETLVVSMSEVTNIKALLSDYGVGELWYLLGEEGLLKEQSA
jgi:predicted ATPase